MCVRMRVRVRVCVCTRARVFFFLFLVLGSYRGGMRYNTEAAGLLGRDSLFR